MQWFCLFFLFFLFLIGAPLGVHAKKYTLDQLKQTSPMVKTKRRAPGSNMVMKSSGVPFFPFVKKVRVKLSNGTFKTRTFRLKKIPRLQVGLESRIKVRPMRLIIRENRQLKVLLKIAKDKSFRGKSKKGEGNTKETLSGIKALRTISPKKFQAMTDKIIGGKNLSSSSLVSAERKAQQKQALEEQMREKQKKTGKVVGEMAGKRQGNKNQTQAETDISWRDVRWNPLAEFSQPKINENLTQVAEKSIKELTAEDLKLLQALIFLNVHKDYHMAIGLFAELVSSKKWSAFSRYSMGLVMNKLNLYHSFRDEMFKLLQDSPEWELPALAEMVSALPSYEIYFANQLEPYINRHRFSAKDHKNINLFHLLMAKEAVEKNDIGEVIYRVDQIQKHSPYYLEGRFLRGVMNYKKGQMEDAEKEFADIFKKIKNSKKGLKSLVALNLARIHFQKGMYRKAFALYNNVEKSHPAFFESLMEKAWNQVLYGDYAGAAGNMFSIQSKYFSDIFKPESYVIRSVGYLNLCQYGDSLQILRTFKKRYTPVAKMMKKYMKSHKGNKDIAYYNTVKKTLITSKSKVIDGLPRLLVWALARHPTFMDNQLVINQIEDQRARWKYIFIHLLKTEKKLRQQTKAVIAEIKQVKANYKKEVAEGKTPKFTLEDQIKPLHQRKINYGIRYIIAQNSRKTLKTFREREDKNLQKEKKEWLQRTDSFLKDRFVAMYDGLKFSVDQASALSYEIFSGAGELLRHQLAGGKSRAELGEKELASSKKELAPEDGQGQNWSFSGKGELWQDEIGNFRSSLKDVCPKREKITQAENNPEAKEE